MYMYHVISQTIDISACNPAKYLIDPPQTLPGFGAQGLRELPAALFGAPRGTSSWF